MMEKEEDIGDIGDNDNEKKLNAMDEDTERDIE